MKFIGMDIINTKIELRVGRRGLVGRGEISLQ
jgi:hypothetical protein